MIARGLLLILLLFNRENLAFVILSILEKLLRIKEARKIFLIFLIILFFNNSSNHIAIYDRFLADHQGKNQNNNR